MADNSPHQNDPHPTNDAGWDAWNLRGRWDLVARWYGDQPRPVKILAFVFLLPFTMLMTYRAVDSEVSLVGGLTLVGDQATIDQYAATKIDIRWKNSRIPIGTTHNRTFVVPIGYMKYLKMRLEAFYGAPSLEFKLLVNGAPIQCFRAEFVPPNILEDVKVSLAANTDSRNACPDGGSPWQEIAGIFSLSSAAHADEPAGDRLFLNTLPAKDAAKIESVRLRIGDQTIPPRSRSLDGQIAPKEMLNFLAEEDVYFQLPPELTAETPATLEIKTSDSWFFSSPKRYPITVPGTYNREAEAAVNGETVSVSRFNKVDVKIFDKNDIDTKVDRLEENLRDQGFLTTRLPSIQSSSDGETNAVFGGSKVPLESLQETLGSLENAAIPIKVIEPGLELRSGNPYEIQIGGTARANGQPTITNSRMQEILSAKSVREIRSLQAEPATLPASAPSP